MPANTSYSLESRKIKDSTGELKTLLRGTTSFIQCNYTDFEKVFSPKSTDTKPSIKKNIIFLGLSYNAKEYAQSLCNNQEQNVYYIECLDFIQALKDDAIENAIPENFTELSSNKLFDLLENINLDEVDFYFYKQNLQLFPAFWFEILYTIQDIIAKKQYTASNKEINKEKSIFLGLFQNDLMFKELNYAIEKNNFVLLANPLNTKENIELNEEEIDLLSKYLRENKPSLFLSINGRCLDSNGRIFYLLEHLKIPVALWIVDNVWNILSHFKSDFWKDCPLFVTDKSFIPALQGYGAKNVHYLPLASHSLHYIKDEQIQQNIELLYVGHSQFKNKNSFFAAVKKDEVLLQNFKNEIDNYYNNLCPLINFNSVYEKISQNKEIKLWPRNDFREISYISSELDNYNKRRNIQDLKNLTIIGDDGWREILGENVKIYPPVDYYTKLQEFYRRAKFTLNIPSLLMPNALTQRHFDVWFSKGFLLSLPTDGLEIFDADLAKAITIENTDIIEDIIEKYKSNLKLYVEIQEEMYNSIHDKHLYIHRLEEICKILGV